MGEETTFSVSPHRAHYSQGKKTPSWISQSRMRFSPQRSFSLVPAYCSRTRLHSAIRHPKIQPIQTRVGGGKPSRRRTQKLTTQLHTPRLQTKYLRRRKGLPLPTLVRFPSDIAKSRDVSYDTLYSPDWCDPINWELVERWFDAIVADPFEVDVVALAVAPLPVPTPPPPRPALYVLPFSNNAAILARCISSELMRASRREVRSSETLSDSRKVSRKLCAVVKVMSSRSCFTCSTVVPILASRGNTCSSIRLLGHVLLVHVILCRVYRTKLRAM